MDALLATIKSSKTSRHPPVIQVNYNDLEHAIDNMGLSRTLPPGSLYHALLEVQSLSTPAQTIAITTLGDSSSKSKIDFSLAGREKRRKLKEMTMATFPNGFKDPYIRIDSAELESIIPFITGTVTFFSDNEEHKQVFSDVHCLWDTGAEISCILSSLLRPEMRDVLKPDNGFVQAEVEIDGLPISISASFAYKERLPNNSQFIILGQRHLIECLEVLITPKPVEDIPSMSNQYRIGYGSFEFLRYRHPFENTVTKFLS